MAVIFVVTDVLPEIFLVLLLNYIVTRLDITYFPKQIKLRRKKYI